MCLGTHTPVLKKVDVTQLNTVLNKSKTQNKADKSDMKIFDRPRLRPMPKPSFKRRKQSCPQKKKMRKCLKPGKTAKLHDRLFVKHNYHDFSPYSEKDLVNLVVEESNDEDEADDDHDLHLHPCRKRKGGVSISFPQKLHMMLMEIEEQCNQALASIVSWQPHGRCFIVRNPKEFVKNVMPHFFKQTRLTSFQRQLNLYGFSRITQGNDAGAYYHELFLRGKYYLCSHMMRKKIKGTGIKAASNPTSEPDFYSMPPVPSREINSFEMRDYHTIPNHDCQSTHNLIRPDQTSSLSPIPIMRTSYPHMSSEGYSVQHTGTIVTPGSSPQDMATSKFLYKPILPSLPILRTPDTPETEMTHYKSVPQFLNPQSFSNPEAFFDSFPTDNDVIVSDEIMSPITQDNAPKKEGIAQYSPLTSFSDAPNQCAVEDNSTSTYKSTFENPTKPEASVDSPVSIKKPLSNKVPSGPPVSDDSVCEEEMISTSDPLDEFMSTWGSYLDARFDEDLVLTSEV